MTINPEFKIGQSVYLKTDEDQKLRICTGYLVRPNSIIYRIAYGTTEYDHYDFEITAERDDVKRFQS